MEHLSAVVMELPEGNEKGAENSRRVDVTSPTSMSFVLGKSWVKPPVFMSL